MLKHLLRVSVFTFLLFVVFGSLAFGGIMYLGTVLFGEAFWTWGTDPMIKPGEVPPGFIDSLLSFDGFLRLLFLGFRFGLLSWVPLHFGFFLPLWIVLGPGLGVGALKSRIGQELTINHSFENGFRLAQRAAEIVPRTQIMEQEIQEGRIVLKVPMTWLTVGSTIEIQLYRISDSETHVEISNYRRFGSVSEKPVMEIGRFLKSQRVLR